MTTFTKVLVPKVMVESIHCIQEERADTDVTGL